MVFGAGITYASANNSERIIKDPTTVESNGETNKSKSTQDKYSFTLFNFFSTQLQSKTDSSSTELKESNKVEEVGTIKTGL